MLKGLRNSLRESKDLGRLLTMPVPERPVVFYAEDTFTYVQYEGYVKALEGRGHKVAYVTSAHDDPRLNESRPTFEAFFVDQQLPRLMERLNSQVLAITMPDLGRYHVPAPTGAKTLYVFHSLNSAHTAYRTGAFDHYDAFLCTGPHHVQEVAALRRHRGLPMPELHEVGYYKLDRIIDAHAQYEKRRPESPTVLVAPSWGPSNLLEAHGSAVIRPLLELDVHVVIRPHPQFFHSLYPRGSEVVRALQDEFGRHPAVEFELSIDTEDSFHEAAVMISDWSGAAYEYALGTLRPVIFVDTPQKVFNDEAEAVGLPSLERELRGRVGAIVAQNRLGELGRIVADHLHAASHWSNELQSLRDEAVFNIGVSSQAGARVMSESLDLGS